MDASKSERSESPPPLYEDKFGDSTAVCSDKEIGALKSKKVLSPERQRPTNNPQATAVWTSILLPA